MLTFHFSNKFWQFLTVLAVAVILLISVILGIAAGKRTAQANLVVDNALAIKAGLEYFNSDYSRFPSAVEFGDTNLMLNYFNIFPPQDIVSASCNGSFDYKRTSNNKYQLNFCLPKAIGKYKTGWNTIQ